MNEFKGTPGDWYIQHEHGGDDFWIKSDFNQVVHYGTDIMCDDFGEQNGYPRKQRLADAQLIVTAKPMLSFLKKLIVSDILSEEYKKLAENLINQATTVK